MSYNQAFTVSEILSLLGLIQSVYVLVYMLLRSGSWKYALIPVAYFLCLACAFLFDASASRWQPLYEDYNLCRWALWIGSVPLGTLLVFQIGAFPCLPPPRFLLLLLLVPLSFTPLWIPELDEKMIYLGGLVAGALSLLAVWLYRDLLVPLSAKTSMGKERFWLILVMIVTNTAFLGVTLSYVSEWITEGQWILIRNGLGIAFTYIAATSLFRIYPQAIVLSRKSQGPLGTEDREILSRIESLLDHEKVYQQPSYGRAEMARELDVGEATLSKIVNIHYAKTIPQLLNDYRVVDAQVLLRETDIPVTQVFAESGFNSMTTFNRVFKELVGISPSEYRAQIKHF